MGTASVAVAAMAPIVLAQPAAALSGVQLRRSTFTPLLGSSFRMTSGRTSIPVVLSKIGDLSPSAPAGDENRFSLLFSAGQRQSVSQATYTLASPNLSVALFLVPVGPPQVSQKYLAIINAR